MSPEPSNGLDLLTARCIAATKNVREHLVAPGRRDPRPPIINFTDGQGVKHADVLKHLRSALDQKAPMAEVDCAGHEADVIPELLTEVKRQLAHQCGAYPSLQFRRLELGLAVIEKPIDFRIQREALRQLKRAARRIFAPPAPDWQVNHLLDAVRLVVPAWHGWVVALAVSLFQSRFPSLYNFYRWYGHRDHKRGTPPIQFLGNLNRWAHPPPGRPRAASHRLRDEVLVEALLADVRSSYSRGRLSRPGWYSAVVLLHNADSDAGVALLTRLRDVRAFLDGERVRAEALLVIAGSEADLAGYLRHEPVHGEAS